MKASTKRKSVASGTVTSGMKISATDGVAFVDFTAATYLPNSDSTPLPNYLGHLLRIYDSSNRWIEGYIKAAGSAETFEDVIGGTNPALLNGDFESAEPPGVVWSRGTGWVITGGVAVATAVAANVSLYQSLTGLTPNYLYKASADFVVTTGTVAHRFDAVNGPTISTSGTYSHYRTIQNSNIDPLVRALTEFTGTVNNYSWRKVLTPSSTGCTISNTKGGSVMNWKSKNASFNYNDSSYSYRIYKDKAAVVVATDTIAAGAAKLDTTTANAFYGGAVDLSAYQTGKHILALYNTTGGYGAIAWISAEAPAGETLGGDLVTDPLFNDDGAWAKEEAAWTVDTTNHWAVATLVRNNYWIKNTLSSASTVGSLYKIAGECLTLTSSTWNLAFSGSTSLPTVYSSTGVKTIYLTSDQIGTTAGFSGRNDNTSGTFDNFHVYKFTAPVATGALLLSTRGGSRGWISKHASFDPNLEMTYKIYYVGD